MSTKVIRDIIRIDEEKCDGCGACVLACAEGAIQVIDGKARLISDNYCDGLGACLGECPQGALTIEKRESDEFDEHLVEEHLAAMKEDNLPCGCPGSSVQQFEKAHELASLGPLPCGCPSTTVREFGRQAVGDVPVATTYQQSMLNHWPVQLALVPPTAPFFQGADLVLAAHCGPFAYGNFHQDFIKNHAVVCACPKLDDAQAHREKLTELLRQSDIKSLTIVRMEVPCCGELTYLANQAIAASGKDIPIHEVTVGVRGGLLQ